MCLYYKQWWWCWFFYPLFDFGDQNVAYEGNFEEDNQVSIGGELAIELEGNEDVEFDDESDKGGDV